VEAARDVVAVDDDVPVPIVLEPAAVALAVGEGADPLRLAARVPVGDGPVRHELRALLVAVDAVLLGALGRPLTGQPGAGRADAARLRHAGQRRRHEAAGGEGREELCGGAPACATCWPCQPSPPEAALRKL